MDRKRIDGLPPWVLTPKEEKEVFENWKTTTYKACDELVKKFADCAASSGYSAWFKCRKQSKVMRDCIASRQATKYVDDERDKYIQEKYVYCKSRGKSSQHQIQMQNIRHPRIHGGKEREIPKRKETGLALIR